MKKFKLLCAVMSITILSTMPVYAGWEQTGTTWKYQNTDNTYMTNMWAWIDGNNDGISECYYFGADGIMLSNATTADGYLVNVDGQWIVNGIVQTKAAGSEKTKSQSQPNVDNNGNGAVNQPGTDAPAPPSTEGGNNISDWEAEYNKYFSRPEGTIGGGDGNSNLQAN